MIYKIISNITFVGILKIQVNFADSVHECDPLANKKYVFLNKNAGRKKGVDSFRELKDLEKKRRNIANIDWTRIKT